MRRVPRADDDQLHAILLSLCFVGAEARADREQEIREILTSFVRDPRPMVAAQAIDTLNSLGSRDVEEQLWPLLHHNSPYVVGSVLRFLSHHDPERARPILLDALESPEPIILQNAVDELDELECIEALPRIRPLLNDHDEWVRQAAQTAVLNLEELFRERSRC
jgi:HEAT repeat protein